MLPECELGSILREANSELARLVRVHDARQKTRRRVARARVRLAFVAGLLAAPLAERALAQEFGLTDVGQAATPAFADIDGDGDRDAFVGEGNGSTIFFENTGTVTAPAFSAPATNPFGLANVGLVASPEFADIDDDGDRDVFMGSALAILFFENNGTASTPTYAAPLTNPFGLMDVGFFSAPGVVPGLADIDGDGDLDIFVVGADDDGTAWVFFENTGTASAPSFAAPLFRPFGLVVVGFDSNFADIDADGDFDAFIGNGGGGTSFLENAGTPSAPVFMAPVTHPFGLVDVGNGASPTLVDIDADVDLDAFIGNSDGNTIFFENAGTTTTPSFIPPDCADGLDNDGDGQVDAPADPGCASPVDVSELSHLQCDNGIDDDGDRKIDARSDGTGDPQCWSLTFNREASGGPSGGCGLGPELLLVAPLLAAARRRSGARNRDKRAQPRT